MRRAWPLVIGAGKLPVIGRYGGPAHDRAVPTRARPLYEASRLTRWQLLEVGREIRLARIAAGMRQRDAARQLRTSPARVSMVERGLLASLTMRDLGRHAAVVGLKVSIRLFPAGRRLLDAPQLELLARLRKRSHSSWTWETEVPMPLPGDLRAADARASIPGCRLTIELINRLSDAQAQSRAARLKKRDLAADRLLLVVRATHANRRALREAGRELLLDFPVRTRAALDALAAGRDPGGDAIVLL